MHTIGSAFYALRQSLTGLYDEREAAAIAHGAMEDISGLSKVDRLIAKEQVLTEAQERRFASAATVLPTGYPLQYFVGKAWFMGEPFIVNADVLIPRPETEELVQWVVNDFGEMGRARILDVGTGSGCIAVSLARRLPGAEVDACDLSRGAVAVAADNAAHHGVDISFYNLDFLAAEQWGTLGVYDVIVSNPPYIPLAERARLHANVREYEPHGALFVPDDDALVFYRAIATFASSHLAPSGAIYCELDAGNARLTASLFADAGFRYVELREDMHGNERMLCARF